MLGRGKGTRAFYGMLALPAMKFPKFFRFLRTFRYTGCNRQLNFSHGTY